MKNKKALLSAVFAAFMLLSACGGSTQKDTSAQDSSTTSQVASASDMADVEDVVEDGMTPITGDKVKDGTYDVTVDSSSNMFNVTACELTVKNGEMTAKMHMGGTGSQRWSLRRLPVRLPAKNPRGTPGCGRTTSPSSC